MAFGLFVWEAVKYNCLKRILTFLTRFNVTRALTTLSFSHVISKARLRSSPLSGLLYLRGFVWAESRRPFHFFPP